MRGYVPQYELAARLIYEAMASGSLRWVGLADRSAGDFDDIVLGLQDRVVGYQVKTHRDPEVFSVRTSLLGADKLLTRLVISWRQLQDSHIGMEVQVAYVTDDFPKATDSLNGDQTPKVSSAALVRTHNGHAADWSLKRWKESSFGPFVTELIQASGVGEATFEKFWKNVRFIVGGMGRRAGFAPSTHYDERRLTELFGLLPTLVADERDSDRWTVDELLRRLKWHDPFRLRHEHIFPIDSLVQSNRLTEDAVQSALAQFSSGYISLIGPPGSGKSTLLQSGLLPAARSIIMRYLAFVPDEGHGLGRAEATDFVHDLLGQFKKQGLLENIIPGSELPELRLQLEEALKAAGYRFKEDGIRTIIVVDGLDHVPREERPQHSLLRELPQPSVLPIGVFVILGTQRLDLNDIPPAVRDQAAFDGRQIQIAPLSRESVYRLANAARLPTDVDRGTLWERSEGHPLSIRYLIEGLLRCGSAEERQAWLEGGPRFGRDVDGFYERAWHELESEPQAREALAFVALAEGALDPVRLDEIVGTDATDAAWRGAAHLLRLDERDRWAIFHNSFRLFLLDRTAIRFGRRDDNAIRSRYRKLAELASRADGTDAQRWLELRYRARAEDYASVLALGVPLRFRSQFVEGRNPGEIQDDIRLGFLAARKLRNPEKLFELILCRNEIAMRCDAIAGDALIDAYIAAGQIDAAIGLTQATGVNLPVTAIYSVVDALLQVGRFDEAKRLFEETEPIDVLLGSEGLDLRLANHEDMYCWARRALIFRDRQQFQRALENLRLADQRFQGPAELAAFKQALRTLAARNEIESQPNTDLKALASMLGIKSTSAAQLRMVAARVNFEEGFDDDAKRFLKEASEHAATFAESDRRYAARTALILGERDVAERFFSGLQPPVLEDNISYHSQWLATYGHAVVLHASIEVQLYETLVVRRYSSKPLLRALQRNLEELGRLAAAARAGKKQRPETVWHEIKPLVTLLQRGEGEHFSGRWELDQALPKLCNIVISVAALHGPNAVASVIDHIDEILTNDAHYLASPGFVRSFAQAAFNHERDTAKAIRRLVIAMPTGEENTPYKYVEESARTAKALAEVGDRAAAQQLLAAVHDGALGIARPARKDAQYLMWRELFERACAEEPRRRPERVRFFARLLDGLSHTEGRSAAHRLARSLLSESYQCESALAIGVADKLIEADVAPWANLLTGGLGGIVRRCPALAAVAGCVFDRLVLPFVEDGPITIFDEFLKAAPADQRAGFVRHAVKCIEVDSLGAWRFSLLKQLDELAREYGVRRPTEALARWAEDRVARPTSSNDDPYAAATSLDELEIALSDHQSNDKRYYAVRKFEELAPKAEYEKVKAFVDRPGFADDQEALMAVARAALAAGLHGDARELAKKLRVRAESEGSWGHWQSGAKHRLHQILVELEGESAREKAFDAFAQDLSQGKEWIGSLLPDLIHVFELLSPRPSWSAMWDMLAENLMLFRDYKLGTEVETNNVEGDETFLIADFLFRALDLETLEMGRQVRLSAIELIETARGNEVISHLLSRLCSRGGEYALEAVRIAWELRHTPHFRGSLSDWLVEWMESDDVAILNYGQRLARELNQILRLPSKPLPAFYNLTFPDEELASEFEPPSGFDAMNPGLWTDDPFSWTWPLEQPLKTLADATNFDLPLLRRRAAQLMQRNGGRSDFGPEVLSARQTLFRRLGLRIMFRRVQVIAAFRAVRQLMAELILAHEVDMRCIPVLLPRVGAPDPAVLTLPPQPRPASIIRPTIADSYLSQEIKNWLNAVSESLYHPIEPKRKIIAAVGSFERTSLRREITEEHLFVAAENREADNVDAALWKLPQIAMFQGFVPLYEGNASGAIASIRIDLAGSLPERAITLCPRVAKGIGLQPAPTDPLSYINEDGESVVRSIWWRDGGIHRRDSDSPLRGEGFIIIATEAVAERLKPFLGEKSTMRIWRRVFDYDEPGGSAAKQACS